GTNPPRKTVDADLPIFRGANISEHIIGNIVLAFCIHGNSIPRLVRDPGLIRPGSGSGRLR
ncbi:hypothetical protein A2U01_0096611, partial [Trifolium medium]|nr:hypothetical protein [Trifolium medium]